MPLQPRVIVVNEVAADREVVANQVGGDLDHLSVITVGLLGILKYSDDNIMTFKKEVHNKDAYVCQLARQAI